MVLLWYNYTASKKNCLTLCRWRFLTCSVSILASFLIPPNFTSSRNSDDDLIDAQGGICDTNQWGAYKLRGIWATEVPQCDQGWSPGRESVGHSLTICERWFHGQHREHEPIMGVWAHWDRSPHQGPGAEPLVTRSGGRIVIVKPPEAERLLAFWHPTEATNLPHSLYFFGNAYNCRECDINPDRSSSLAIVIFCNLPLILLSAADTRQ